MIKKVLKEELEEIEPRKVVVKDVKKVSNEFISALKEELDKLIYGTQVFVGGSFAKGTLVRKEKYDVDIFVRFDWRYDNISEILEKALKKTCESLKLKYEQVHGSRDYYRVYPSGHKAYFELIPVTKIKKPREARNVTDLSYFHVSYVKRKARGLEGEIMLAKKFFEAQKVYGAESYVQGFSGYAIECLIIYYKSFVKMLRELNKVKKGERLIIDIEKHYKRKNDVLFEINESKLHSPIIVVDPTFKERNALASLNDETFERFQKSARKFLKNPSRKHFIRQDVKPEKLKAQAKKVKGEFMELEIKTDRQEGDVAGTKLKKFSRFLELEMKRYFLIKKFEFEYDVENGKLARVWFVVKSKGEIERIGPPVNLKNKKLAKIMEKHAEEFKGEHKKTYVKNGSLCAKIKVNFSAKEFLENWVKENKHKMKDMGITQLNLKD